MLILKNSVLRVLVYKSNRWQSSISKLALPNSDVCILNLCVLYFLFSHSMVSSAITLSHLAWQGLRSWVQGFGLDWRAIERARPPLPAPSRSSLHWSFGQHQPTGTSQWDWDRSHAWCFLALFCPPVNPWVPHDCGHSPLETLVLNQLSPSPCSPWHQAQSEEGRDRASGECSGGNSFNCNLMTPLCEVAKLMHAVGSHCAGNFHSGRTWGWLLGSK